MLLKRLKIETSNLECGMYVAQLDRPWLETPFLFKGFEIRDDKELRLLRNFCKHVYVDATQGSVPKDRVLEARRRAEKYAQSLATPATRLEHAARPSLQRRLFDAITRLDRTGTIAGFFQTKHYRNAVPTRLEAPRAALAYDAAAAALTDVLEQFQQGRGPRYPAAEAGRRPADRQHPAQSGRDGLAGLPAQARDRRPPAFHRQRRLGGDPRAPSGL